MDKTKIKEALDCAYELEALMEMAANREPLPERIADLISDRSTELKALIDSALGKNQTSGKEQYNEEVTTADNERIYESAIEEEEADSLTEEEEVPEEEEVQYEDEEETVPEEDDEPQDKKDFPKSERKDLRHYFSINDKFRFRRELFSNSQQEFIDAINLVEAMHGYDEAEEYFYDDLNWDRESEEVQQFMDILSEYFKK